MKKPYLKISRLAEDQDLNQGALAALIGVSSNTMTARLKGTQPWRSDEIVIICRALHIPQEKNRGVFLPGNRKGGKDRMKPYTLASERAAAPTGCAYIAPLFWNKWFRWGGSQASGCYQLGGQIKDESHTGLQIFADGEWHPVIGWALDDCRPAVNCLQEVGA